MSATKVRKESEDPAGRVREVLCVCGHRQSSHIRNSKDCIRHDSIGHYCRCKAFTGATRIPLGSATGRNAASDGRKGSRR